MFFLSLQHLNLCKFEFLYEFRLCKISFITRCSLVYRRVIFTDNLGDLIFTKRKGDSVHQWWHEDIALKALPKKAFKKKGKLVIPQVRPGDKGLYIYEDKTKQGKKIKNKNLNISSRK